MVAPLLIVLAANAVNAQPMKENSGLVRIRHIDSDFNISELDNKLWADAEQVEIDRYWSGEKAPKSRYSTAQLLWSDRALYVRFVSVQNEPLIAAERPDLAKKSIGLWDRDVCEIFIAPDKKKPNNYFEFEIAPNGEWIDLGIEVLPNKRITDWEYASGMRSAARVENEKVVSAIKVEWEAFGRTPNRGETWRGNLFRCVGKDPGRGYLAWRPTLTKQPAFHVPDKFGVFEFVG